MFSTNLFEKFLVMNIDVTFYDNDYTWVTVGGSGRVWELANVKIAL